MNRKAEEIRIRYLYRNLLLRKKIRLPFKAAVEVVGPDCAYHLYPVLDSKKCESLEDRKGRSKKGRRH